MKYREVVVVIPVKPLHKAKSRLSQRLTGRQRAALTVNMLGRVVSAAVRSTADRVWVIGGDQVAGQWPPDYGVEWRWDTGSDLNDSLWQAFQMAFASDLIPFYLAADLPFVTSDDVAAAILASESGSNLTLCPEQGGGGTNGMIVPLGSSFRPALGEGSFRRHKDQAKALGLPVRICDSRGLRLDLDTLDDLTAFENLEPGLLKRLTTERTTPDWIDDTACRKLV